MIFERIRTPGPEARLLPAEKLHGPTVAVTAIMTFAMIVVAAAGLALANAASVVTAGVENKLVVQVPVSSAPQLSQIAASLRSLPGISGVTAVSEREMRETLERWLGSAAASKDLPVPALVTVELIPGANAAAAEAAVRKAVPDASVSSESAHLKPLLRSIRGLQWLALSLVLLMAVATAAAIVLASRGALDTHRSTVEIMHGIGATDTQVTRLFERKIAVDAVAGALCGLFAAGVVLLLLGGGIAAASGDLVASAPFDMGDLVILAAIPVAAVILAVTVAHITLLKALRATL